MDQEHACEQVRGHGQQQEDLVPAAPPMGARAPRGPRDQRAQKPQRPLE